MRIVSAGDLDRALSFLELIAALRRAFQAGVIVPVRHHHTIPLGGGAPATLLLMPAWDDFAGPAGARFMGVKIVSVHPDNVKHGLPTISGAYLLMDAVTGAPQAVLDGPRLTLWRTAAASALAATYLARADASRLLLVGAGALAPFLIAAHASVRPLTEVLVWNRNRQRAEALSARLSGERYSVKAVGDLEQAARSADIVSCATLSSEPLVRGAWLKPGTHVDLVGAFTSAMRESDDAAVRSARVYVDTREGALAEAGDIVQPIKSGVIGAGHIVGDLFGLSRGEVAGRGSAEEITLFKSVGTALEDLAAAACVLDKLSSGDAAGEHPARPGDPQRA